MKELAGEVGIVPATLVLYKSDKHQIKYCVAVKLTEVLKIDWNQLLDTLRLWTIFVYHF